MKRVNIKKLEKNFFNQACFGDVETSLFDKTKDVDELEFKLMKILDYNNNMLSFYNVKTIRDYFELLSDLNSRNERRKIVYFHNLGFDARFFLHQIDDLFDENAMIFRGSDLLSVKCYSISNSAQSCRNRKVLKLEFRDSLAVFLRSLDYLSRMVNVPKLSLDNLELRCENDVKIMRDLFLFLFEWLKAHFPKLKLSFFPLTIASLSLRIFDYFNKYDIYSIQYDDLLRKYYFGGRTEVFNFNNAYCYYNDINSSYPSVMVENNFPLPPYYQEPFLKGDDYFAVVMKIQELTDLPYFPERLNSSVYYVKHPKIVFAFREELEYLLKNQIISVDEILYYYYASDNQPIFRDHLSNLYRIRKLYDNKHPFNYLSKIFMNALYGKFAQKSIQDTFKIINATEYSKYIDKNDDEVFLDVTNGFCYVKGKSVTSVKYRLVNLLYSMKITALGRLKLYRYMLFPFRKHILYYGDSDSCVTSEQCYSISGRLGEMKVENEGIFQAYSQKEYEFYKIVDGQQVKEIKMKSFKNPESIRDVYQVGKRQYRVNKIKGLLNRELELNVNETYTKNKRKFYDRRIINEDLTTSPLLMLNKCYVAQVEERNREILNRKLIEIEKYIKI